MGKNRINELIDKYFDGKLTETERLELMNAYDRQSDQDIEWMADSLDEADLVKRRMFLKIKQEIFTEKVKRSHTISSRLIYAAASLLVIAAAGWLFFRPSIKPLPEIQLVTDVKIVPGSNKAKLTFEGQEIVLNSVAAGKVLDKGGVDVFKNKEGQVVFNLDPRSRDAAAEIMTVTTPRGGQYEVVLSDGTKIWLNSESSIQFPTKFSGTERNVSVKGEAYIEVFKDKNKPFKVTTVLQEIEVLGTHFNVMAYEDESSIKTTLLEGSVCIYTNNIRKLLIPGQQAELSKNNGLIDVHNTSVEAATAWKNGVFMFENENMRSVLNMLSRWYDVKIFYQNKSLDRRFSGSISKFDDIRDVLKTMEMTGTVRFEIRGRSIYVMD